MSKVRSQHERALRKEARRLLEEAARHADRLVPRGLKQLPSEPAELLGLLGVEGTAAQVRQSLAALSLLSEMFQVLAAYTAPSDAAAVLTVAQRRGERLRNRLIATRALLASDEFASALQITHGALLKALEAKRVFAIESDGENYYPAFLADPSLERRRVESVVQVLGNATGWEKWLFFTTPKTSLGRKTPIEAMKQGAYSRVRLAAAAQAER